jgi:DNA-binding transcriptional regulator LsrR (DeoR family)
VFDLSMTRVDIANYLGMAVETVSRLLTQLQNEQVIKVEKRRVSIVNITKLNLCQLPEIRLLLNAQQLHKASRQEREPQAVKVFCTGHINVIKPC